MKFKAGVVMRATLHIKVVGLLIYVVFGVGGCVERLITVTSRPSGAIVWLNGEEVGETPVTTAFTWYGDYDVVLRKEGYETVKTHREAQTPWYQWPVIDLAAECVLPLEFVDHHEWDFEMQEKVAADPTELIERAGELRQDAMTNP